MNDFILTLIIILYFVIIAAWYLINKKLEKKSFAVINGINSNNYDENNLYHYYSPNTAIFKTDLDNPISHADLKKSIINIVYYVICFFLINSILSSIMLSVYLIKNNIDVALITEGSASFDADIYNKVVNDLNPIFQLMVYTITIIGVLIVSYKWLLKDLKLMKKKYFIYAIEGFLLLILANIISSLGFDLLGLSSTSSNQDDIESMLNSSSSGFILTAIVTIVIAPILEELIFRKSIFNLCANDLRKGLIISSLCFGALHVISPVIEVLTSSSQNMYHELVTELIYIIPYSLMGAALGYAYLKSGQNVICSIIAHLINNALSIILTLIAFSVII